MTDTIDWGHEGREVGVTLDACHAVVVVGSDPVATCEAALGIARVQAQHRRVAVVDLFGDAPPLQSLVPTDDPHGIVDSFVYGVSMNRIAYKVPDAGELFVIPSGTEPLDYAELFHHPRWKKLASGFGEVGALILVAAPTDAPEVCALVDIFDGAVLVGDAVPPDMPVAAALAWIRLRRATPLASPVSLPPAQDVAAAPEPAAPPRRRKWLVPMAGVLTTLALAAGAAFLFTTPPGASYSVRPSAARVSPPPRPVPAPPREDSATRARALAVRDSVAREAVRRDSVLQDSLARAMGISPDSFPRLAVVNPLDSASAAAYSVFLEETLTKSGAILNLAQKFKSVPVGTYGVNPRTRFFSVYSGAYPTRAAAESLLTTLRERRLLGPTAGSVIAVPYAYLVQSDVPAAGAAARVARYRAGGHPVYALRQPNGTAQLYFGAYASPLQAALALPAVKDAKLTPTLVYRTGRVF